MKNWQHLKIESDASLKAALALIDSTGWQIALVLGNGDHLLGVVTDGDIRRALLRGVSLESTVDGVMNRNPRTLPLGSGPEEILGYMRKHVLHHIPLVEGSRLVELATLDELIGAVARENPVVLMAGGMGRRLRPLTQDTPKPLLSVGGQPILQTIIENLSDQGFRRFFLSVNYKAEMIQAFFGDGSRWGVSIEYLLEEKSLGTAGALSLLPPGLEQPLLVMNGDLLTKTNFDSLLKYHEAQGSDATMTVREFDLEVPYGVVKTEETNIIAIEEKPVHTFFVNAGIYVLSPEILTHVPHDEYFDMTTLFRTLIDRGRKVRAYHLREYWLDIGRLEEFEKAQREWNVD